MLNKYIILLAATLCPALIARAEVGGEPVAPAEAMNASLVNVKLANGMCSGTVLSPHVVLVAAHCQDYFGKVQIVAHLGAGPTDPCDVSPVVETAYEPNALPDLPLKVHSPDLLLLRLQTPLCHARAASIDRTPLQPGDEAWSAGYGRGSPAFGQATRVSIRVIPTANAMNLVSPMTTQWDWLLHTGARTYLFALPVKPATSLCDGDSGGPVYREIGGAARVFGVNGAYLPNQTLGAPDCDRAYLQLLTPVAPYADWIESKINEWQ